MLNTAANHCINVSKLHVYTRNLSSVPSLSDWYCERDWEPRLECLNVPKSVNTVPEDIGRWYEGGAIIEHQGGTNCQG